MEFTDEFELWWNGLDSDEQVSVNAAVVLLQKLGPNVRAPYSSNITTSKHAHMRELRIQHRGEP